MKLFKIIELEPTGEYKNVGGINMKLDERYHLNLDLSVNKKELNKIIKALGEREDLII